MTIEDTKMYSPPTDAEISAFLRGVQSPFEFAGDRFTVWALVRQRAAELLSEERRKLLELHQYASFVWKDGALHSICPECRHKPHTEICVYAAAIKETP